VKAVSPLDYRELAKKRLPDFLFEYLEGGAQEESTLKNNRQDIKSIKFKPRVLRNVSDINLSTSFFGQEYALPVGLAPVGIAGLYARRGEVQAVAAAENSQIPFCLSTVSVCPLNEVAAASRKPFWFQLYMIKDRGFMRDLLISAKSLGCSALIFTVDMPVPGIRYRDYRTGLAGAPGFMGSMKRGWQAARKPAWAWDVGLNGLPHHLGNVAPVLAGKSGLEDFFKWMADNFDPTVTWKDLDWIRQLWDGPLIVKGILDVEDAKAVVSAGADGLVVSNHGGRQLEGAPSSTSMLPKISAEVGEAITIFADSGIRSGSDILKMLALGADGVLLGRSWVYALAASGQAGVEHLMQLIEKELRISMALSGVTSLSEVNKKILSS